MDCIKDLYLWKEKDNSFIILKKIEHTVSLLSQKENRGFDEVYADFLESNTYRAIQDTRSLMWYENAEFIVDEYYREKSSPEGQAHV
jgi:hypothetical protein